MSANKYNFDTLDNLVLETLANESVDYEYSVEGCAIMSVIYPYAIYIKTFIACVNHKTETTEIH